MAEVAPGAIATPATDSVGDPAGIPRLPALGRRTLVMGILNVTPDSFSDGGRFAALDAALTHAAEMVAEGADILDIGGESTRPGSSEVGVEEEIARVVPVIERLAKQTATPISIDTYKAETARRALAAGAGIVNDVWGLQREPDIARVAADFGAPVVVMHNRREVDPAIDIVADMIAFFERSAEIALKAGIPRHHVVVDPGIGFGKTVEQNLQALKATPELKRLGFRVLIGTSRKSLIGKLIDRGPGERLYGTIASNVVTITLGADIVRVHDVLAHVEAARVADAILRGHP